MMPILVEWEDSRTADGGNESQTMGRTAIAVRQVTKLYRFILGQTIWSASAVSCPGFASGQNPPTS